MTVEYREASEPRRIATDLIKQHHTDLSDAFGQMRFVFRSEAAKKGGRVQLGAAKIVSGLNAWLVDGEGELMSGADTAFFVIEIAEPEWKELSEAQRVALVDHELSHCLIEYPEDPDATPKLKLRAHDLEEFVDVVRRHGLWKTDVEHFAKVGAEQLHLNVQ